MIMCGLMFFIQDFQKRKKAWVNFLGAILFLIPFCILVIYLSKDFVINSFLFKETSPDAGGLPASYIIKSFIPISFIFLLLQGISLAFKSFLEIKNYTDNRKKINDRIFTDLYFSLQF